MLNAIAKMTTDAAGAVTDAAGAVADKVTDVLPIPGKGGHDESEPADADVARDQDTDKTKPGKKKPSKDQTEGPVSRPLDTYPTVSGDLDVPTPETTDKDVSTPEPAEQQTEQDAGPTFETTEKTTTPEGKDEVVTNNDDVQVPEESQQEREEPQQPQQSRKPQQKAAHKDTQKQAGSQGQQHKRKGPKDSQKTATQDITPSAGTDAPKSPTPQQSFTAGSQPQPKMSPGKLKWMSSHDAWYPDRAGVLHAPGFYINRKPRANFMNPMHKVEVSF